MAYVSKTWVDRDSQYPTRRIIVHPDLTEEQVTVRRDEGIITTQGDVFDANTMNNLEARIAAGLREKQDQLTAGTGIDITNNVISATGGGGASALDDLTDVDINSPTNGQALVYDAGNDVWVNGSAGGGGSSSLAELTDVALATPTDGQALCYDASTQKWKNSDAGGAGAMVEKTATGAVASFPDGADNLPLKSVICAVSALQSGSGDPSTANVRPITGFTGLTLHVADGQTPHVVDNTYPVTWQSVAGTVYGCFVNITTGLLTVTHVKETRRWDSAISSGSSLGDYTRRQFNLNNTPSSATFCLCSVAPYFYKYSDDSCHCYIGSNEKLALFLPNATADSYEFDVVYELATPLTYQLSPQEIKSLLGANNIWHDANGDTTVTYRTETAGQILDVVQENTGVEDLSDVSVSNVSNGQVLKYNSTSQKWENSNESGGAEIDDTTTAQNKVWSSSKTSTELSGKQGTLTAGTGIAIDSNNVISATGGGGGGSYTAGEKIRIDSQDVISADPQYNIIWNGDSLADVKSRHLVGGLPYGFSKTDTASGFDVQNNGFKIDGNFSSDDYKHIIYEPPVSFNDPTWRSGVSDFILELYWTDDPQAEPVIYTKEVLQLEVNGTPETLTLNGIELSVNLASGSYGGLIITIDDTSNADGDIWITGLNLTVKNSTGMLWTPHDLAIQEYVAAVAAPLYVELNGTLAAGSTTVTLSNSAIRTTSTFDIYTDVYGVNPTAVAVSNGSMTLTFEAQQSAINVKVRVT